MYSPKNVLVTGGCGFIGSNVLNFLCTKYPDIHFYNIDKLDYCSNIKNVNVHLLTNYTFYKCDISNSDMVSYILKMHEIDTVIHFAAQSQVDNSFEKSIQFTVDNVLGTHILLETCRAYGKIQKFIHISTDEVYGEVELDGDECHETKILKPTNPYAATKASAEHLVFSYFYSFKLPIIVTRGNNVYGSRQYPEKLIPKFITLLENGKKCTVHGGGQTVRNFIHVDDVSTDIETILFQGKIGEIYNIGSKNEYSVLDITKKLVKFMKNSDRFEEYLEYVEDRNFNDLRYSVNNDKLKSLGWKENKDFDQGLEETIKWYLENKNHWNHL